MEHKTLYQNGEATLTALAVLPVERAVSSSSVVLQSTFGDAAIRLNPGEELRLFLYAGTAEGILISLRCTLRVSGGTGTPENIVSIEAGRRQHLGSQGATTAVQESGRSASPSSPPRPGPEITFLSTCRELPLLFALCGGRVECLRCTDLCPIGPSYFKRLTLPADTVVTLCATAKDQVFSQSPFVSLWHPRDQRQQQQQQQQQDGLGGGTDDFSDNSPVLGDSNEGYGPGFMTLAGHKHQRLALVASPRVYLLECSQRGAFHMHRANLTSAKADARTGESRNTPLAAILSVPADVGEILAVDWQVDTVLVGTRLAYVAYSAVTCLALHRMDMGTAGSPPRQPSGTAFLPLIHYVGETTARREEDLGYADAWAFAADLAAAAEAARRVVEDEGASDCGGESDAAVAATNERSASLVFRTPDNELHLLNCLNDCGDGVHADLPATDLLETCIHPVTDAFAINPFLIAYRASRDTKGGGGGGQFVLQSCYDKAVWASPAVYPGGGDGGDDGRLGTATAVESASDDAVVRVDTASRGVLTGLIATPIGVLGFTKHSIEAVLLKPPAAQLNTLVAAGQYATALSYFLSGVDDILLLNQHTSTAERTAVAAAGAAPCGANSNDDDDDDDDDVGDARGEGSRDCAVFEQKLKELYRTCATHALASARYEEAFQLFARADTPVTHLLRLFPEFHLPQQSEAPCQQGSAGPPALLTLSYPHSETPYRILHGMLIYYFNTNIAPSVGGEEEEEEAEVEVGEGEEVAVDPPATQEATAVEYALFLLYTLDHGALGDREAVAAFLASAAHLPLALCLSYVSGTNAPYPRPDLVPLLLAGSGRAAEGLALCQKAKDVDTAGAVLRMSASSSDELYATHLPWMLRVDADATVSVLVHAQAADGERRSQQQQGHHRRGRPAYPSPQVVIPPLVGRGGGEALHAYLTYQIYACGSVDKRLHSLYATNMVDMLELLTSVGLQARAAQASATSSTFVTPAGGEPGVFGTVRRALLQYLSDDVVADYDEAPILARLRKAGLLEEQVVVLHRLHDHVGALRVLTYDLNDVEGAVQYCLYQHERAAAEHTASSAAMAMAVAGTGGIASPVVDGSRLLDSASPTNGTAVAPSYGPRRGGHVAHIGKGGESVVAAADTGGPVALPSGDCLAALSRDLNLLRHFTEGQGRGGGPHRGAPGMGSVGERFNHYLHLLLQVLWMPPTGEEPKTDAALHLLNVYSHLIDPVDVLQFLPGDVPLPLLFSYLARSFQSTEFDVGISEAEAAATRSVAREAEAYYTKLQERCVAVDGQRRCAGCRQPLREKELLAVFPNLKVTHFRCQQDSALDPERGVAFRGLFQ